MFRESDKSPQLDMYLSLTEVLQGFLKLSKNNFYHIIFREHIAMSVNEVPLKVPYSSDNSSLDTTVHVLAGMMILKKGWGG